MTYTGSCYCGRVRFDVDGDLADIMACNYSMCSRKASLQWFVLRDQFKVFASESDVRRYSFNRQIIRHCFCRICGIHLFEEGTDENGMRTAAVNVRCLDNIDTGSLVIHQFDGKAL